jgi:hypothetical protein
VLSVLVSPRAPDPILFQILDRDRNPVWWPAEMFQTVDTDLPSNWTIQLWDDGSLHLAPAAWLRPGFWEEYWDQRAGGAAADVFRREAEIILREAEIGRHAREV